MRLPEAPVNFFGLGGIETLRSTHHATLRIGWFFCACVVWELSHFVYHWTCRKVRLPWVLHSPHHAPTHMALGVIFAALFPTRTSYARRSARSWACPWNCRSCAW